MEICRLRLSPETRIQFKEGIDSYSGNSSLTSFTQDERISCVESRERIKNFLIVWRYFENHIKVIKKFKPI
jgi:hypothetical protein